MSFNFNPFTGTLDITSPKNYSYDDLQFNLIIPQYQQMIVYNALEMNNYSLEVLGKLVIID